MRLQCLPSAVAASELFFCKSSVDFLVADAMHGVRLAPALAFRHQVMLVDAFACNHGPVAQWAILCKLHL